MTKSFFETSVSAWNSYLDSSRFMLEVALAIGNMNKEDQGKLIKGITPEDIANVLRSVNPQKVTEGVFYQKLLEQHTNKYLKKLLLKVKVTTKNSEEFGLAVKQRLRDLSEIKPYLLSKVYEDVQKIPNKEFGEFLLNIIHSEELKSEKIFTLIKKGLKRYIDIAA